MNNATTVGVIGLGAMGKGMASSLRRAGYAVHVCDARPGAAAEFAADGGVAIAVDRADGAPADEAVDGAAHARVLS